MPGYQELHRSGELTRRIEGALSKLRACELCPHRCGVDRAAGDDSGVCGVGRAAQVASYHLHFGEERPLVGGSGSGTIFFTGCNLRCHFCQNYDISRGADRTYEVSPRKLATIILSLQRRGAVNINFVTPSHVVPQILEALPEAIEGGLSVPLVYNTSGYDSVETLELLEGVIDIYMPDAKFTSPELAGRFSEAEDYPERAREAIAEMHRQVGDLVIDDRGIATEGLLVRHLVMPEGTSGTAEWMRFLAEELSTNTYVNIMGQYRPCGGVLRRSGDFPELGRPVNAAEIKAAYEAAAAAGITRLDERRPRFMVLLGEEG